MPLNAGRAVRFQPQALDFLALFMVFKSCEKFVPLLCKAVHRFRRALRFVQVAARFSPLSSHLRFAYAQRNTFHCNAST